MTVLLLGAALLGVIPAVPAARNRGGHAPGAAAETSVPGVPGRTRARGDDPEAKSAMRGAPAVAWPAAGAATVAVPASRAAHGEQPLIAAGGLPVRIGPAGAGDTPGRVRVEAMDHAALESAGIHGLPLRVERADAGAADGRVLLEVDYSRFRHAYGGDWASRLSIVQVPSCALTTPAAAECRRTVPVSSHNDPGSGRVAGEVTAPARGTVAGGGTLYAVAAGSGGAAGSFTPTPLAPSATWEVGLQSGDFTWSYPMDVPSMPGPEPDVALGYSSGAVDGRVSGTNNQSSWVGEGFDFQPGYIERSYKPCRDDGQAGAGDECWVSSNATVVLPGVGGELVRDDATGTWRAEEDDGWRVELLTGADNGDNDGEYWRLTSPDGTQYFFGRNRQPGWAAGNAESNSVATVPVFGNNPGEPCYSATFAAAWCQQAWRWGLDYVLDRHGNVITYYYSPETNYYARTGGTPTAYTRASTLSRIEYGQRDDSVYTTPAPARVLFTTANRCITGTGCTQATPADWPDVPWDQSCGASTCAVTSPTYWSTQRLAGVKTQVYTGGGYADAESWTLTHSYPASGDGADPVLWLDSIVHTGLAGGSVSEPAVTFDGVQMQNRVDLDTDGQRSLQKRRIQAIYTESGGAIKVTYSPAECAAGALPAADSNTAKCFPAYWTPSGATDPALGWFHKYVVTQVVEQDLVGGNPNEVTSYEYVGGGAWHYQDAELVPDKYKTWGQWRGFQKVRVRTGDPAEGRQTLTEHLFLRGMDGDLKADAGRKDIWVSDSQGGLVEDRNALRGFGRETIVYNGDGGAWLEDTLSEPVLIARTASRSRPSGVLEAYLVDERSEVTRTALSDGTVRTTQVVYGYDSAGLLVQTNDLNDTSTATDDTCTRVSYARNATAWILDTRSRVETVARSCDAAASYPADLIADTKMYYDGSATWGAAPATGDLTRVDELSDWSAAAAVYRTTATAVFDARGRELELYDALGNKTTTSYTPALGAPVTSVRTTNALGFTATTDLDPVLGVPTSTVDANGLRDSLAYDALGRLVKVWKTGRGTDQPPDLLYSYQLRNDAPSVVTTQSLLDSGQYATSYTLLDGALRGRQTQSPSPTSGWRIVTDTFYDSHGRVAKTNAAYANHALPGTTRLDVADSGVPSQTVYQYDGAGRRTADILRSYGTEKWRTTTSYGGNWTAVDPPDGETATMTIEDALGRPVELRQYTGGAPSGGYDATRYTYTTSGKLGTVTDPAGNVWRNQYDLRGRKMLSTDPDSGAHSYGYDALDRLVSTTDSRGRTISWTYDALGRRTATYEGGTTDGVKLAEWTYDTLALGALTKATRYVAGNAYTSEVLGYDSAGRPTGTAITIPAAEGALAGRYESSVAYNSVGQVSTMTLPAAGGLPAETLTYGYNALGLSNSLTGLDPYVAATGYTNLGAVSQYTLGRQGKSVWQTFTYDQATGRVTRARTDRQGVTPAAVADLNYTYDPGGNVVRVADTPSGGAADVQCFRYDYLRRLTEAWSATDACAGAPGLSVLGGPAPYWESYTYDKVGNRLTETRHATSGDTTRTYAYPAPGSAQPHTLLSVTQAGPGGSRVDTFGYDSEGNTTSRVVAGTAQNLTWDAEGHLAAVTQGGASTSYLYDPDGNRLLRRDPSGTTLYLGDTELRLSGGTVTGTRYYTHNGVPVVVRTPAAVSWLVSDLHGTPQTAIDATTLAVTTRRTTPFGGTRGAAPAVPGERGFHTGNTDASTGLVHLGAREYDPATGRFLSVDPIVDIGDPQQMQGYAYAANNPTTFADPDGLLAVKKTTTKKTTTTKTAKPKPTAKQIKTAKKKEKQFKAKLKAAGSQAKKQLQKIDKYLKAVADGKQKYDEKKFRSLMHDVANGLKKINNGLASAFKDMNKALAAANRQMYDYFVLEVAWVPKVKIKIPQMTFSKAERSSTYFMAIAQVVQTCGCVRESGRNVMGFSGQALTRYQAGLAAGGQSITVKNIGVSLSWTYTRGDHSFFGVAGVVSGSDGVSASARVGLVYIRDGNTAHRADNTADIDGFVGGWGYAAGTTSGSTTIGYARSVGSDNYAIELGYAYPPADNLDWSVSFGYVFQTS